MNSEGKGEIIVYRAEDGRIKIDVRLEKETIWLSQADLVALFQTSKPNISEHLKHIFEEEELDAQSVVRKFRTTASDGKEYDVNFYNLDVVIALGFRVKSRTATRFRIWATERLKEYLVKGFTMDDDRLKQMGGGGYWHELLNRIRDIRSSEKVFYRQVLDLYATSIDYDPQASESIEFFKVVQNKLHYAAHGHTAAEVIYQRADADKPFMGLTVFNGKQPTKKEIGIAKNYLYEEELKILNNLVSGYFDFAEIQAIRRKPLYMKDYLEQLDKILASTGEELLQNAGIVSHEQAMDKALSEYKKYHTKTLSEVEKAYLKTITSVQKKIERRGGKKENNS
ncbi:MAG: virulence RhuM family protein [Tannerellaceae bacterium]|nr:virulence RhuM family protein [Tannerellaceae bacterium]